MGQRVVWAQAAVDDLRNIRDYIARDSPRHASATVQRLQDAARSLRTLALRGRIVPELDDEAYRELIVGSYRLIYHVSAESVAVVRILHGARDLPSAWEAPSS
jgi:addiction module RelE/StbE family toxin